MNSGWQSIWDRRTTVFGYLQVIIATLAVADPAIIEGLLGAKGVSYLLGLNAVLTACLGHYNNHKDKQ